MLFAFDIYNIMGLYIVARNKQCMNYKSNIFCMLSKHEHSVLSV